jgi:glycolate oxidase iron-sulfur subunit
MTWVTEFAPESADLNACIQCGLCLPFCPTFRLTGDETASPRGRLTAMSAAASGEADLDARFEEIMGFCLQCRACEAVCPSLVPFGKAMEGTRAEIVAQNPTPERIGRRLVLGRLLALRPLVMLVSWLLGVAQRLGVVGLLPGSAGRAAGLRSVPLPVPTTVGKMWEPDGQPIGTAALLAGCVMDPWYGSVHEATVQVLRVAGYRVAVPGGQTCCGALAAHEGAAYDAARLARRNVKAFTGYDVIVVDAAGCSAHLKDYGRWADGGDDMAGRVVDVTELVGTLLAEGRLPRLAMTSGAVAVQDPCHLRHAQGIVEQPRAVVRAAGYHPVDVDTQGLCCGAAGAYALSHAQTSDELGRRKAGEVLATGAGIVASANPGCDMQLCLQLDGRVRVAHPIELYWEAIQDAVGA